MSQITDAIIKLVSQQSINSDIPLTRSIKFHPFYNIIAVCYSNKIVFLTFLEDMYLRNIQVIDLSQDMLRDEFISNISFYHISEQQSFFAIGTSNSIKLYNINLEQNSLPIAVIDTRMRCKIVEFQPKIPFLATVLSGSEFDTIVLWKFDYRSENKLEKLIEFNDNNIINCIAFHPNPRPLFFATGSMDGSVILWQTNLESIPTTLIKIKKLQNHTNSVNSVAFHSIYLMFATGSSDNTTKLWNFKNKSRLFRNDVIEVKCFATLEGHNGAVNCVAFHPSKLILATSNNITANFWIISEDSQNGDRPVAILIHNGSGRNNSSFDKVNSIGFHPSGTLFATLCNNFTDSTKIWLLNEENGIAINSPDNMIEFELEQPRRPIQNNNQENYEENDSNEENGLQYDILVSQELLNPRANKDSCQNFTPLYNFIMQHDALVGNFTFKFEDELGIDYRGLSRIIFDKIYPVYIKKFFIEISQNKDYIILKPNLNYKEFKSNTLQLMLLAKRSKSNIFLNIDPTLFDLLSSENPQQFINNSIESHKNKYKETISFVNHLIQLNESNNQNQYLIKNNSKMGFKKLKEEKNEELKKIIKKQILFRKFALSCGFETWEEFQTMQKFIKKIWLNPNKPGSNTFTNVLKFDKNSIKERIKIIKIISPVGELKRGIEIKMNDLEEEHFIEYPYLKLIINYILGGKSTDKNRINFVRYVTGSSLYPGIITIDLSNEEISNRSTGPFYGQPFLAHTCLMSIDLFKKPRGFNINKNTLTNSWINSEIIKGLSSKTYQ